MKKFAAIAAAALLPVLILSGCLNYEQKATLNADGSGEMEIHYWTKEDNVQWMGNDNFSFQESEIKNRYTNSGVEVEKVTVDLDVKDSTRHVRLEVSFKDINKLSETAAFKNATFSFKPEGDKMVFKQTIKGSNNANGMGMEEFKFIYSYTMPGEVVASNATKVDGSTLTWQYSLPELSKDVMLTATVSTGSGFDITMILGIVGLVLFLGVIVALLIRRKKPAPSV